MINPPQQDALEALIEDYKECRESLGRTSTWGDDLIAAARKQRDGLVDALARATLLLKNAKPASSQLSHSSDWENQVEMLLALLSPPKDSEVGDEQR